MKAGIHPKYAPTKVTCACGAEYDVVSTQKEVTIGICSKCHPFFTGKRQQLLDRGGRVEQFRRRYNIAAEDEEVEGSEAEPAEEAAQP